MHFQQEEKDSSSFNADGIAGLLLTAAVRLILEESLGAQNLQLGPSIKIIKGVLSS